ncbi:uncharacterized protein LOC143281125 [Babylonia areolata]|uniref:uncharacterized protein LOC143281125 n=1 Tax=Babylonia areolata TaxID=304850 RepID=UPI003FD040C8
MHKNDVPLLCLMGLSTTLYSLAAVSHAWFTLPPHSFYGLWSVEFCDFLQCQIIPALFSDEPDWYHVLQLLSVVAWVGLVTALLLLLLPLCMGKHLPQLVTAHRTSLISTVCLVSATAILASLVVFYSKLCESSDSQPHISWSSILAAIACAGDFTVALLVMKSSS